MAPPRDSCGAKSLASLLKVPSESAANELRAAADAGVVSGAFLFRADAMEGEGSVTSSSDTLTANPTRELAAIMFSDVVGYTAIMGRDEREGLRAVREHREHLRAVLPQEVTISRAFWLLMHADSKDLARIRAVADYIYETVEAERALFSGPRM